MLGFTKTEERVVVILIGTFLLGSTIRLVQSRFAPLPKPVVKAQWVPSLETGTDPSPKQADAPKKKDAIKNQLVEINSATHEDLILIPGIGPVLADRIIQYRESKDGFTSIEELKNIKGVGQKKFENLKSGFIIH